MRPTECPHCQQLQFGGLVCTVCGRILYVPPSPPAKESDGPQR
jgi:hypothetical protein